MSPAVAYALIQILEVFSWVLLARVLLTWVIRDPENPLMKLLRGITDPVVRPLSPYLTFGGMDLAPLAVFMILRGLQMGIARLATGYVAG